MDSLDQSNIGPRFGVRHKQCLILFSCHVVMYAILHNISLAVVAMTDSSKANPDFEEFDWNEETKSFVLSGFLWGYMLSQVPFASLAERFGGKRTLLAGVALNSAMNLLIPKCTSLGGSTVLFAFRVFQGLFQGCVIPSTHTLLANWSPIAERALLSVLCYPGAQIGAVVMLSTGGLIASSSLGWPGIFYIWGGMGILWCILYAFVGANGPDESKAISEAERNYILRTRGEHKVNAPIPWGKMFRSQAFLALLFTHICHGYGFWMLQTTIPTYIKGVFGTDIEQNALLATLPFFTMFVVSQTLGLLAHFCINRLKWRLSTTRKVFNWVGLGVPGVAMAVQGFMTKEDFTLAVIVLTIAMGMAGSIYFGYYVNHMDICPTHAGLLMGITNSIATVNGIISTLSVGWIVSDETNPKQWQIVFSIGAGCQLLGATLFACFAKFEDQKWIEAKYEDTSVAHAK